MVHLKLILILWTMVNPFIVSVLGYQTNYVCPPKFNVIGKYCYHFSKDETIWQDAHFRCLTLNNNSTLAIVKSAHQEFLIRKFLDRNSPLLGRYERWIGGRFNWKKSRWEWGINGKPLKFQGFSRMNTQSKDMWKWHCIIIDPARFNKWGARNCLNKKHYVCQTHINRNVIRTGEKNKKICNNSTRITTLEQRRLCNKKKKNIDNSIPGFLVQKSKKTNKTQVYNNYICPPHMILIGRKCYYFSMEALNWDQANFACLDNHTKLAMIHNKLQDNILRGFLNHNFIEKHERWIGAIYDWRQNKWKWALNGRILKYKNFAYPTDNRTQLEFTCASMDPRYKHKWIPESCVKSKYFICQTKPKTVIKYDEKQKKQQLKPKATVVIKTENELDNRINLIDNSKTTEPTYLDKIG